MKAAALLFFSSFTSVATVLRFGLFFPLFACVNSNLDPTSFKSSAIVCVRVGEGVCVFFYLYDLFPGFLCPLFSSVHSLSVRLICSALYFSHLS